VAAAEADEENGGPPTAQGEVSGSAGRGPTSRGCLCRNAETAHKLSELKCTARRGYVCVSTGRHM
jgi:hypothetical protein